MRYVFADCPEDEQRYPDYYTSHEVQSGGHRSSPRRSPVKNARLAADTASHRIAHPSTLSSIVILP